MRKACPVETKTLILEEQDYRCSYCGLMFGSVVQTRSSVRATELVWDHFVPYVYINNNPRENWIASCDVCNSVKNSLMFTDFAEAKLFVIERWHKHGYMCLWEPPVSSAQDPHRWATKYATYLATKGAASNG